VNNKDFENLAREKSKNFKINKLPVKILANNQLTKTSSSSKNNITTTASKYISTKKSIKSTATTINSSKKYNNNNSNLFLFEEEIMMKKKSTIMYLCRMNILTFMMTSQKFIFKFYKTCLSNVLFF